MNTLHWLCLLGLLVPRILFAQANYAVADGSEFVVNGTSTLSDWSVKTQEISGEIELGKSFVKKASPKKGAELSGITIRVPVNSLDGGRGDTMNDKIKAAFQASEHPEIIYVLSSATVTGPKTDNEKTFLLDSSGTLSMAGNSQEVSIPLEGSLQSDGSYLFSGTYAMKMSEFGMEPPSAMFGQIIAGDQVEILFKLRLTP